jgi:hypothetical protein
MLDRPQSGDRQEPPRSATAHEVLRFLCVCLVFCGFLASAVLLLSGLSMMCVHLGENFYTEIVHDVGLMSIGLSFFVGPLLIGIAAMLCRLN